MKNIGKRKNSITHLPPHPQDAELKVMVKKILEGANLEEVTMKSVCRQVYDSYPDFDLTHKKVFIKETVKSVSVFCSPSAR